LPQTAPNHDIRCQFTMGSSRAGHCRHGQSNTPYLFPICFTSHAAQLPIFLPTRSLQNRENGPTHANHLQVHWNLLVNSPRYIQSSSSPPPHTPKYTSIIHRHFGRDYNDATIHRQHQTISHHRAIANTPIIKTIA